MINFTQKRKILRIRKRKRTRKHDTSSVAKSGSIKKLTASTFLIFHTNFWFSWRCCRLGLKICGLLIKLFDKNQKTMKRYSIKCCFVQPTDLAQANRPTRNMVRRPIRIEWHWLSCDLLQSNFSLTF